MGHGALDEDRAHDPEQGQPCAEEGGDASDRAKGRHLTDPIYKELPNGPVIYVRVLYCTVELTSMVAERVLQTKHSGARRSCTPGLRSIFRSLQPATCFFTRQPAAIAMSSPRRRVDPRKEVRPSSRSLSTLFVADVAFSQCAHALVHMLAAHACCTHS